MSRKVSGFTLIEVIIAGALVATTVGAIYVVAMVSSRLLAVSQERVMASRLADEGIEITRLLRNEAVKTCKATENCTDWSATLLDTKSQGGVSALPIIKGITQSNDMYSFETISAFTDAQRCSDYLVYNSEKREFVRQDHFSTNSMLFCRRLIFEPYGSIHSDMTKGIIRVRSQVAWLGHGKSLLRIIHPLRDENSCSEKTEWCVEAVSLLGEGKK